MAIAQGNTINAADIAARYTSYDLVATNGNTATLTLPGNSGYVFFTYDTANHSVYGNGIAFFIDSTNGWCIKQPVKQGTTVSIGINKSNGQVSLANSSGSTATMFLMWVGANT